MDSKRCEEILSTYGIDHDDKFICPSIEIFNEIKEAIVFGYPNITVVTEPPTSFPVIFFTDYDPGGYDSLYYETNCYLYYIYPEDFNYLKKE